MRGTSHKKVTRACVRDLCRSVVHRRTRPGKSSTDSPSTTSPARRWKPQRPSWWRSETPPWTSCHTDYPALPAKSSSRPRIPRRPAARGSKDENKRTLHSFQPSKLRPCVPLECVSVCVCVCVMRPLLQVLNEACLLTTTWPPSATR